MRKEVIQKLCVGLEFGKLLDFNSFYLFFSFRNLFGVEIRLMYISLMVWNRWFLIRLILKYIAHSKPIVIYWNSKFRIHFNFPGSHANQLTVTWSHLKSDAWPKPFIRKWATNSFCYRDANLLMSVVMLLVSIVYNFWQCIHSFGRRIIVLRYSLNCWLWIFVCNLNREGGERWVQY